MHKIDKSCTSVVYNSIVFPFVYFWYRVVLKNDEIEMSAHTLGLTMESNGVKILEPFDTSVKYSSVSGKTNIRLSVSNIFMNFSFSILRLFIAVEEDILSFLRMTSRKMTVVCSEFDKIGTIRSMLSYYRNLSVHIIFVTWYLLCTLHADPYTDQIYAFWRPHPPPGFASLGDYLTPLLVYHSRIYYVL